VAEKRERTSLKSGASGAGAGHKVTSNSRERAKFPFEHIVAGRAVPSSSFAGMENKCERPAVTSYSLFR
jgi:hypothetical protein